MIPVVVAVGFSLASAGARVAPGARSQASSSASGREPVLVELFTSEGCSSCPPADTLLAELDSRQPFRSAEIIAIEEHVDYWDQQGWKDPFSSADWTFRQNEYASSLHNGSAYTPEMVVDGTEGFVGSRGPTVKTAIEKAASLPKAIVEITEAAPPQKSVVLKVAVEKLPNANPKDSAQVLLAITESGLHSAVKEGENAGRELQHSAVLRELKVIGTVGKNGEAFAAQPTVKLDSGWNVAHLRAVVFVQEKKSRRVLGAAEITLAPETALR